ncbi:hypothetical protein CF319_g7512 [Tilletia indica]|nr:hypothetical protein CF319_g7512 [Tilletia indica]
MKEIDVAERSLSRAIHSLNDAAQAAGYKPDWVAIINRLLAEPAKPHIEKSATACSPSNQQFECVSIPATSLLLPGIAPAKEVYVRPGRKPTPRQEGSFNYRAASLSLTPPTSTSASRNPSRHIRCHKCSTSRNGGTWRFSVLGAASPPFCLKCYGKEYRRRKKVSHSHPNNYSLEQS